MMKRALIILLVFALLLPSLSGCSQKSPPPNPAASETPVMQPVYGKLELPAGMSMKPESLKIVTSAGETSVLANGSFSAQEPGPSPALAFAVDGEGMPVLFGFVRGNGVENKLNTLSTAAAMLFQGLAAYTLPRENWPDILTLLEAHPASAELANALAGRLAAKPKFFAEKDPEILAALQAAIDKVHANTVLSNTLDLSTAAMSGISVYASYQVVAATDNSTAPAEILIEPSQEVSGALVGRNANGNGIVITNNMRRHLWAFVYRTGWKAKEDDENTRPRPIDPWEPILGKGTYIRAVDGFQGTFGTVLDAMNGSNAYTPVTSEPIILTVEPEDAVRTYYTIVVIGPAWTAGEFDSEVPAGFADRTAEIAVWQQAEQKMDALTWFQEFFFPAILTVFPAEAIGKTYDSEVIGQLAQECTKMISNIYPDMIEQMSSHDYRSAMVTFLKAFDNDILREALVEKMIQAGLIKGGVAKSATALLAKVNIYISAIDKFLTAGDLGLVISELCSARRFASWIGTAVKPYIRIQNNPSIVTAGLDVALTCYGVAGISGIKEFEWQTAGQYGHLEDSRGHSGLSFTTNDQSVRYVADEEAKDGDEDTVRVTVRLKVTGQKKELGKAEADVFIVETPRNITFIPSYPVLPHNDSVIIEASILPSFPESAEVSIGWTCTNQFGTLTSLKGEKVPFEGSSVRYTAGEKNGSDTITATAWQITSKGKRIEICSNSVPIQVGTTRIVHISQGTGWANGLELVVLVFKKVEKAKHYYVTWHFNGYDPSKLMEEYKQYLKNFFASKYPNQDFTPFWNSIIPQAIDGKRIEVAPLKLEAYNDPEHPIAADEAGILMFFTSYEMLDASDPSLYDFNERYYDTVKQLVSMMEHWTADLEVE